MEATFFCTVYFMYFRCGPHFIINRFHPLFLKSVPYRSVHKIVYCVVFILSKMKDIPMSGFCYECCYGYSVQ